MYNKDYYSNMNFVRSKLKSRALLEALAEEASELSQAALKMIRAKGSNGNPTPISAEEAEAKLLEEIADVRNCINVLGLPTGCGELINEITEAKMKRWVERLESVENEKES